MTGEERAAVQRKLSCYVICRELADEPDIDGISAHARMFLIRRSVMRLPESREKLFLYQRYIRGESMERCAELLCVSRRSIFRLSTRALELYLKHNPPDEPVRVLS